MTRQTVQPATACDIAGGHECTKLVPGHAMHVMQVQLARSARSGWRDGLVDEVTADGWIGVTPLDGGTRLRVWHHAPLAPAVGEPVSVHGTYHVLAQGRSWYSVLVVETGPRIG